MESHLKEIARNTKPKDSLQIIISGNTTTVKTQFNPPIQLDKESFYEIALVNLETYFSFPNIDATKNHLRYSPNAGTTWYDILISEGCYDVSDLSAAVELIMKQNGHFDMATNTPYISISANASTLKTVMTIANNYQVDFTLSIR